MKKTLNFYIWAIILQFFIYLIIWTAITFISLPFDDMLSMDNYWEWILPWTWITAIVISWITALNDPHSRTTHLAIIGIVFITFIIFTSIYTV